MPAFLKLGDIKGESTDTGHPDWIRIDAMSSPIMRSIPQGAKDQQRARGETTLGDISISKQVDKSTPNLLAACANGKFIPEVQVNFCTTVKGKQEPYMTYKLKNVVVTSHSFHGVGDGSSLPTEEITLGYTEVDWNYVVIDPNTGANKGNVPAKYQLGKGAS